MGTNVVFIFSLLKLSGKIGDWKIKVYGEKDKEKEMDGDHTGGRK